MKNMVMIVDSAILGTLTLMIVMAIYGKISRSMEIKSYLSYVVEETVENMVLSQKYSVNNVNEFLADMVSILSVELDSKSNVKVDILQCDKEKGILNVRVILSYTHPNGRPGKVKWERNVIVNKMQENVPQQYDVQFYVGSECYKEYMVNEKDRVTVPSDPLAEENRVFYGWVDENGNPADFSQPITQNMSYYADIR